MIINKLSSLLVERQKKISRVSMDTGISRTTLTSLYQNTSKMFQIDTVNTLCNYLNVTPSDFFEYSPIDYKIDIFSDFTNEQEVHEFNEPPEIHTDFIVRFTENNEIKLRTFEYNIIGSVFYDKHNVSHLDFSISLENEPDEKQDKIEEFLEIYSVSMRSVVKNNIVKEIIEQIKYQNEDKIMIDKIDSDNLYSTIFKSPFV